MAKLKTKSYLYKNTRSGNLFRATPWPAYVVENLTTGSTYTLSEQEFKVTLSGPNIEIQESQALEILYGKENPDLENDDNDPQGSGAV
jgi:hypothetical protein